MEYEEPKITNVDPLHGSTEKHPAYAQILANRVSGHACLYGSDFTHQHYITISICNSELHRSLNRDWSFGTNEYIEVSLSEAQWAAFVSSMNVGSGVQCTLNHLHGKMVPQIPKPKKRHEQFKTEVSSKLAGVIKDVRDLQGKIAECSLSGKKKDELARSLSRIEANLSGNLEFVADQFGEHMEKVTENAKTEVNAYIVNTISRAGLAAIKAGDSPIALIGKDEE